MPQEHRDHHRHHHHHHRSHHSSRRRGPSNKKKLSRAERKKFIKLGIFVGVCLLFVVATVVLAFYLDLGRPGKPDPGSPTPADTVGNVGNNNAIVLDAALSTDRYTLRYEGADGILEEYAPICELSHTAGSTTAYEDLLPQNVAPADAMQIGVYAASGDRVGSIAISPSLKSALGKKLYSFAALSDPHVGWGDTNFSNALIHLTEQAKVDFIAICGDLTDASSDAQWATYKTLTATFAGSTPIYAVTGNHDGPFYREDYSPDDMLEFVPLKDTIADATGQSLYYSFTQGNDVFIMMGVQSNQAGNAFSQAQLQWLYDTLEANRDKRCFVFEHILPDNGSGNVDNWYQNDNWDGTEQKVMESLLRHYSNVTLFHGHSHQRFDMQENSPIATYDDLFGCHSVHIPSVGGTKGPHSEDLGSSQGYIVEVYTEGILLKGMDFSQNAYLPIAQYYLETKLQTVAPDTYDDPTATVGCKLLPLEWTFATHVDKSNGKVYDREEYASSSLIPLVNSKTTYFHNHYGSAYPVDVACYDSLGNYLGYFTLNFNAEAPYHSPVEMNDLVPEGTASIRLRMYTGEYYSRKTAPIFLTVR